MRDDVAETIIVVCRRLGILCFAIAACIAFPSVLADAAIFLLGANSSVIRPIEVVLKIASLGLRALLIGEFVWGFLAFRFGWRIRSTENGRKDWSAFLLRLLPPGMRAAAEGQLNDFALMRDRDRGEGKSMAWTYVRCAWYLLVHFVKFVIVTIIGALIGRIVGP